MSIDPANRTPEASGLPDVTAVIPTHNRPELMRRALASVLDQDYAGHIEIIVVFDKSEIDESVVEQRTNRVVRVAGNERTPGLAGARNTGILRASGSLVAFLDDDDAWVPTKLSAQVAALAAEPAAELCTTAMLIEYDDSESVRLAGRSHVDHVDLIRSRMSMLHSSSFVIRREALVGGIGLVDETLPKSMAEDWDLLLRAARRHPIVNVDQPLVRVRWGETSYFAQAWEVRNQSQLWLLEHHPAMRSDPHGAAHSFGKLAFGSAALGHRRESVVWAWRAMRSNWREPRAYIALGVVAGVPWRWAVEQLNQRGHGI
jgi:glycosyltransferase involved in cell wall biosynthesis